MVEALDDAVSKIVQTLKEEGLYDKTLIVFTSDIGGLSTSEGKPPAIVLRAGKGWMYEGGIREPLLIRLPGVTKPGSVSNALITAPDFYQLYCITNQSLIPSQHIDGQVLTKVLKGKKQKKRTLFWHYPQYGNQGGHPASCIMEGEWKLIKWYTPDSPTYELFNVNDDIGEQKELSGLYPKRVASIKKLEVVLSKADDKYPIKNPNLKIILNGL